MADRKSFDMIDFVNVQFYNQISFPSADYVFVKDVYNPRMSALTCLAVIARNISNASAGAVSVAETQSTLLLGFPCKNGSFSVGDANLNKCAYPQFKLVNHRANSLNFFFAAVFEQSADFILDDELSSWNTQMGKTLGEPDLKISNTLKNFCVTIILQTGSV